LLSDDESKIIYFNGLRFGSAKRQPQV